MPLLNYLEFTMSGVPVQEKNVTGRYVVLNIWVLGQSGMLFQVERNGHLSWYEVNLVVN